MRIIDVGGYNNNCGLYALALATSLAISETVNIPEQIPAYVRSVHEDDISPQAPLRLRNVLASKLRNDLYDALRNDPILKNAYLHKFIQACSNDTTSDEKDFEDFQEINNEFVIELQKKLNNIAIQPEETTLIQNKFDMQTIEATGLQVFMQEFLAFLNVQKLSDETINNFANSHCDIKDVLKLFRFSKMLHIVWNKIDTNKDNVPFVKQSLEKWFLNAAADMYLSTPPEDSNKILIALSYCRRYMGGSSDISKNIREIYAFLFVRDNFEQLYNNYSDYIRKGKSILSYDELSCLARKWGVKLNIDFNGCKYTPHVFDTSDLVISLLNTDNNWQIKSENVSERNEETKGVKNYNSYDNTGIYKINDRYKYTREDVKLILEKRLEQLQREKSKKECPPFQLHIASNSRELQKILLADLKTPHLKNPRTLIIACQAEHPDWDDEWYGILIEFNADGKVAKAKCLKSLAANDNFKRANAIRSSAESAMRLVNRFYEVCSWTYDASLTEFDIYSSGVLVVENLIAAFIDNNESKTGINPVAVGYREHHGKMLKALGFKDSAARLYKSTSQHYDEEHNINDIQINDVYVYDKDDISALLRSRIYDIELETPEKLKKPVYSMVAVYGSNNKSNFESILEQEGRLKLGERILLIACKLDFKETHCWVGISLSFDAENNLESSIIQDVSGCVPQKIVNSIESKIATIYSYCCLEKEQCIQEKGVSIGAYLVENLILSAQDLNSSENPGADILRQRDILSLRNNMPEFYRRFVEKQSDVNANSDLSNESISVSLERQSPAINDLFMTIRAMNDNLSVLFGHKKTTEVMNIATLKSKYHTVLNTTTGNLELQLNEAVTLLGLEQRLNVKYWKDNKTGMLWSYKLGLFTAAGGAATATVLTLAGTAEVAVEAAAIVEGATIAEGVAQVGARSFLGPIVGGIALIISAGLVAGQYLARRFAQTVKDALDAYNNVEIEALKIHEENLEFELARVKTGRSYFSQGLRYMYISNDLHYLAKLLLAQIKLKRKNEESVELFEEVFTKSNNETLKAMSLVGQIEILSQQRDWKISIDGKAVTQETRKSALDDVVKKLNEQHIDVVKNYFEMVFQAYNNMFEIAMKGSFLKSAEKFAVLRAEIERVTNFKDMHILKYLEPHGRLAENMFTFAQALAYAMLEEHDKKCHASSNVNDKAAFKSNYSEKVMNKLQLHDELVRNFVYEGKWDERKTYEYIHEVITQYSNNYKKRYRTIGILNSNQHEKDMREERVTYGNRSGLSREESDARTANAFKNVTGVDAAEKTSISSLNRKLSID